MQKIESKVVLITGASSGLGLSTASFLAERGYRVYGTSRNPVAQDAGWPILPLDVRSDESVAACVDEVKRREGRIHVLVNNAGYAFVGAVEETTIGDAKAQLETNFFGPLRMMLAVLPQMRSQNFGRIINVSSVAGVAPPPFLGAYGASKHALEAISESLDYEVADTGIRVSLIEPEGMRTSIGFHHPQSNHPVVGPRREHFLRKLETSTREDGIDPGVFAREVAKIIEGDAPPLRVVIGDMAKKIITARRIMPEEQYRQLVVETIL